MNNGCMVRKTAKCRNGSLVPRGTRFWADRTHLQQPIACSWPEIDLTYTQLCALGCNGCLSLAPPSLPPTSPFLSSSLPFLFLSFLSTPWVKKTPKTQQEQKRKSTRGKKKKKKIITKKKKKKKRGKKES